MNLKLVIRESWEIGYGVKRIVDDADFEFTLSHAGWVGEMRLFLPRPDFDFLRLGDEIEVVNEDNQVIWLGKVIRQEFDQSNKQIATVKGIMEWFYDLPVDAMMYQQTNWTLGQLWLSACMLSRVHHSRLIVPSASGLTDDLGANMFDFRGHQLGDVFRVITAKSDVVIDCSIDELGRIKPQPVYRSEKTVILPRQAFGQWQLIYDASNVRNRIFVPPAEENLKNFILDGSFEDWNATNWEVSGSGSGWSVVRKGIWDITNRNPSCQEATTLQVVIPAQSPAGSVTITTKNETEFKAGTVSVKCFVYSTTAAGQIQAFIGSTAGTALNIQAGWNLYSWSFNVSSTRAKVSLKIYGTTSQTVSVNIDAVTVSYAFSPFPRIVGASESEFVPYEWAFLSSSFVSRVLKVTQVSGNQYDLWLAQTVKGIEGNVINAEGELWDFYYQREWRFIVNGVPSTGVLRVTITKFPIDNAAPYEGTTMRLLKIANKGFTSEAYYGVRYETVSIPLSTLDAYLYVSSRPIVQFVGDLVDFKSIVPVDRQILVLQTFPEDEPLPIVSNQLTVKSGFVINQRITAGDSELTLRGLLRKMRKDAQNYTTAKTR